jgi:hypothetical protein
LKGIWLPPNVVSIRRERGKLSFVCFLGVELYDNSQRAHALLGQHRCPAALSRFHHMSRPERLTSVVPYLAFAASSTFLSRGSVTSTVISFTHASLIRRILTYSSCRDLMPDQACVK